jgi:Ca2+:H+ antiporter
VFTPIGFIVNYLHLDARTVFALKFIAIIPSTMMISLAVNEIALRTGDVIGALLNMSFSNATQLISSNPLLRSRQITVLGNRMHQCCAILGLRHLV